MSTHKPWHSATEVLSDSQRLELVQRAIAAIEAADPTDFAGVSVPVIVRTFSSRFGVVADEGALYPAAEALVARAV